RRREPAADPVRPPPGGPFVHTAARGGLADVAGYRMIGRMPGQFGTRLRRLATVAVALYAVFLVASPFEHHDLQCELRTPLHCTACTGNALGSDPQTGAVLGASPLVDAGSAVEDLASPH